jgi:predicted transglutaminase-like cysteine proteinase
MKKLIYIPILLLFATGCVTTNSNLHNMWKTTQSTPYDKKYEKILKYLVKAQNFRYISDKKHFNKDYWQNPDEIEISKAGDCEDKSLWLYSKLIEEGFTDIRLVIGKYKADNTNAHVWVEWYNESDIFILDGTYNDGLQIVSNLPVWLYKPLYSYYKDQKWKHVDWKVVETMNENLRNSTKTKNTRFSLVAHPNRNIDLNLPFSDQQQLIQILSLSTAITATDNVDVALNSALNTALNTGTNTNNKVTPFVRCFCLLNHLMQSTPPALPQDRYKKRIPCGLQLYYTLNSSLNLPVPSPSH